MITRSAGQSSASSDDTISFTRKDTKNKHVTVVKNWGTPTRFMDQYISGDMWKEVNKFNLFYVIQTKITKEDDVFKIGISSGERRLKEYLTFCGKTNHPYLLKMGSPKDRQSGRGVYLWYLAGQRDNVRDGDNKRRSTITNDEIVKDYYTSAFWSKNHESRVINTLKNDGFTTRQGEEWFIVNPGRVAKFKQIVTDLSKIYVQPEPRRSPRI